MNGLTNKSKRGSAVAALHVKQDKNSFAFPPPETHYGRMTEPSLEFLGRQTERILQELASLRDAVDVLTAMSMRHKSSIQAVVQELQAIHRHNAGDGVLIIGPPVPTIACERSRTPCEPRKRDS